LYSLLFLRRRRRHLMITCDLKWFLFPERMCWFCEVSSTRTRLNARLHIYVLLIITRDENVRILLFVCYTTARGRAMLKKKLKWLPRRSSRRRRRLCLSRRRF
jgi:hypothetical protein